MHREHLLFVSLFMLFCCCTTIFKTKTPSQPCPQHYSKLVNLFTVMCTNIANGTNITLRDGCIGCFQAASNVNNQPSVTAISACAQTYLANTNYSTCFNIVQGAVDNGIDPRGRRSFGVNIVTVECVTGYCGFVRCIRNVNADILISICYNESRLINSATYANQQVNFYKNITACILARSRCSTPNPITGNSQNGRVFTSTTTSKFGKITTTTSTTYYYSLQITESGNLRIIGLPGTVAVQRDFCAQQSTLSEASWMNYTC